MSAPTFAHYRYTRTNGDAKDWLIAVNGDTVEVWFGKMNNTLQIRTIPSNDANTEMHKRIAGKVKEGYQYIGEATIANRRAIKSISQSATPVASRNDPDIWLYNIMYNQGLPLTLAPDVVEKLQKSGLRIFDKGNCIEIGSVKIYKAPPRMRKEWSGEIHLPEDLDASVLLLALQKHTRLVSIVKDTDEEVNDWRALLAYSDHLTPAHHSAGEATELKLISLDRLSSAQSMFF